MKPGPLSRLEHPRTGPGSAAPVPGSLWDLLGATARDKGVLDPVDLALIRTLARRAGRQDDAAFQAVLGCLLAAVRAGGLRIPLDPDILAVRLEELLKGLVPSPEGKTASDRAASRAGEAAGDSPPQIPFAVSFADALALEDVPTLARRLAGDFTRHRLAQAYAAVLGSPPDPGLSPQFLPLLQSGGGLYFQKHQAAEASVGARLAYLLTAPDAALTPAGIRNLLDTVLAKRPLRLSRAETAAPMEFDPGQQAALAMALRKRLTVISGGPGTGKTSLAANLLRAWTRAWVSGQPGDAAPAGKPGLPGGHPPWPRIQLAAPTGRAAQRLAESLRRSLETVRHQGPPGADPEAAADAFVADLPCKTLHALLRYNPGTGEFFHQRHRPLPADLVVVDEVSMVDIFTLSRLLEALEDQACLVLLGDMDQLPSVEAGSVLADLIPGASGADHPLKGHLAVLERSHRSQQSILDVTRRINAMDPAGALAAMPPPMALNASAASRTPTAAPASPEPDRTHGPWPLAFVRDGRKVCPDGGCRLLLPRGGTHASAYRAGWGDWLESWVDFHYLEPSFDPARLPGRTAAPPRVSYEALVDALCAYRPPAEAVFHAALAWKPSAPGSPPEPGLAHWLETLGDLFAYLDQARILTLTRKGWHGSVAVNRRILEYLSRRLGAHPSVGQERARAFGGQERAHAPGTPEPIGAPILILENDHGKGLFNGDVGVLLRMQGRTLAFFRRADGYLAFPAQFLPRHEPAFAMTVHKSQGSEYDQVLLVLPESGNRLLYKETLYTALTRARHFAAVYGPAEVFREAVLRKVVRESGLPEYLKAMRPV